MKSNWKFKVHLILKILAKIKYMNMVNVISTTELVVFKVLNVLSLFNQKQYMPGKQDLRLLHVNVFSLLLMCLMILPRFS